MTARSLRAPLGSNPYVVGPAVYGNGPFFGRQSLIDQVSASAQSGPGLAMLHGPRRIGKTSLLRHIEAQKITGIWPLYLEPALYAERSESETLEALATEILSVVHPDAKIHIPGDDPAEWGQALYKALLPKIKKRRLYLLVDEVSHGQKSDVMYGLLALAGAGARVGGLFVVADLNKRRLPPALVQQNVYELGILSVAEAKKLIEAPVAASIGYEEEAVLHLMDLSGRHPAILQFLCCETFDRVRARPVDSISMIEVVGAAQRIESGEEALSWLWDELKPEHQRLLAALAEAAPIDRAVFRSELDDVLQNHHLDLKQRAVSTALRQLAEMGLLRREGRTKISFSVELLRPWILRFHPLDTMVGGAERGALARKAAIKHLEAAQEAHTLGRLNHALEEYRRAFEADPDFVDVALGYGRALSDCGKHIEAVELLTQAMNAHGEPAKDEWVQAHLSWIADVREAGKRYDNILADVQEIAPDHPDVKAAEGLFMVDEARAELLAHRTREATLALGRLQAGGHVQALATLENLAQEHLLKALQNTQGRRARIVEDYVDALKEIYPKNHQASIRYIRHLLTEAERVEQQSPPGALSQYRRAQERVRALPEGAAVPPALLRRLENGMQRINQIFIQEQEAALEQMMEEGQFESAASLAGELLERHQSAVAMGILKSLKAREAYSRDYQRILDLMASDRLTEARSVARALHQAAPDFVGSDGRSAEDLLQEMGPGEVTQPAMVIPPAAKKAPAPTRAPQAAPIPVAEVEAPAPAAPMRSQDLPIPPPVIRQNNAPLWGAIVLLALLFIGYIAMQEGKPEPAPVALQNTAPAPEQVIPSRVERDVVVSGQNQKVIPKVDHQVVIPSVVPEASPEMAPKPQKKADAPSATKQAPPAKTVAAKPEPEKKAPAPIKAAPASQPAPKAAAKAEKNPPAPTEAAPVAVAGLSAADRNQAEKYVFEGRRQVQRGAYRSAADSYEASLKIDEHQSSVWQDLGLVYYALKQYGDAERALKRALTMDPAALIRFDLAKVYRAQKREAEAKREFEKALEDPALPSSMAREAKEYLAGLQAPKSIKDKVKAQAPQKTVKQTSLWGSQSEGEAIQLFGGDAAEGDSK